MRFRWGGNFARVVPPSIDRKRRREAASFPRLSNTASRIAFHARTRELDSFSLSPPLSLFPFFSFAFDFFPLFRSVSSCVEIVRVDCSETVCMIFNFTIKEIVCK